MEVLERPTFDSEASKDIYQYVERHGTAARHKAREQLSLSPEEFRSGLDRLTSKGYLEDDGGTLRLALDIGSVEEYAVDDTVYTIRPARQADFEGVVEAIRDATADEQYVVAESVAEQLLYEDAVTRHNTVESRVFFVAVVDDEIVGWAHLDLPQVEQLRDTAQLTIGVDRDHRRLGIGSRLMERSTGWAEANGFRKVYNSVPAVNERAMAFLEAHGWHTEGIRKNHYTIDGETVDEVMMTYSF